MGRGLGRSLGGLLFAVGRDDGLAVGTSAFFPVGQHGGADLAPTWRRSAVSLAGRTMIFMPFSVSAFLYQSFFSSLIFQPRASAAAPAFSRASWLGLSSASKAFLLTSTAFFGNQAWVSYPYLMLS